MDLVERLLAGDAVSPQFQAALDHTEPHQVAEVLGLARHCDPAVRRALSLALPLLPQAEDQPMDEVLRTVIELSRDADDRVRDYACMALGTQWRPVDTPELRSALADRLDDPDRDARHEALVGLAYRGDPRALPRVRAALSRPDRDLYQLELIAAGALADPTLHDLLSQHQDGWDGDTARIAEAARRLSDPAGPGEDLLAGVADLYRRRSRNQPDGDAIVGWQILNAMLDLVPSRARAYFDAILAHLAGDPAAEQELRRNSALAQMATDGSAP